MNSVAAFYPAEKPPRCSKAPTVIQKSPQRFNSDHGGLKVFLESQVLLGIPTNLVAMTSCTSAPIVPGVERRSKYKRSRLFDSVVDQLLFLGLAFLRTGAKFELIGYQFPFESKYFILLTSGQPHESQMHAQIRIPVDGMSKRVVHGLQPGNHKF